MENELLKACKYLMAFVPDWAKIVPRGLDPTFYGTLSYEGDLNIKNRIEEIQAMIRTADNKQIQQSPKAGPAD